MKPPFWKTSIVKWVFSHLSVKDSMANYNGKMAGVKSPWAVIHSRFVSDTLDTVGSRQIWASILPCTILPWPHCILSQQLRIFVIRYHHPHPPRWLMLRMCGRNVTEMCHVGWPPPHWGKHVATPAPISKYPAPAMFSFPAYQIPQFMTRSIITTGSFPAPYWLLVGGRNESEVPRYSPRNSFAFCVFILFLLKPSGSKATI